MENVIQYNIINVQYNTADANEAVSLETCTQNVKEILANFSGYEPGSKFSLERLGSG